MDSYDLGVSGDTTDLVQLTMEFVDEDVVPLNVEADVLECRTVGQELFFHLLIFRKAYGRLPLYM